MASHIPKIFEQSVVDSLLPVIFSLLCSSKAPRYNFPPSVVRQQLSKLKNIRDLADRLPKGSVLIGHQLPGVALRWCKAVVYPYLFWEDSDQQRGTIVIPKRAVQFPEVVVVKRLEFLKVDDRNIAMKVGGVNMKLVSDFLPNVGPSISNAWCIDCHQTLIV